MGLKKARAALNDLMALRGGAVFQELVLTKWFAAQYMIQEWRNGLKAWEAKETFDRAYQADRMSVRTFEPGFDKQYNKEFTSINIAVANRFRPDSTYSGAFDSEVQKSHVKQFNSDDEKPHYHAKRGLDGSAFANPENFLSRAKKYANGLHDLSASLLNHDISIYDQIHNKEEGAFFAFLPLPEMEDQALLYSLIRAAKALRSQAPEFYTTVRFLRAEITRVKLAAEFDMAIGYTAMPVANPGLNQPKYKLRYGLTATSKPIGNEVPDAKSALSSTNDMKIIDQGAYEARQQSGIRYKDMLVRAALRPVGKKNEILLAVRHHNGGFPLYAQRQGAVLKVITIDTGAVVETAHTITPMGVMT